tara:strand:+ start:11746 stop:11937 length:192 start_codon:yes stop_codon:yes gene_type:complete
MTDKQKLKSEIEKLSNEKVSEVLDYVRSLVRQASESFCITLVSEPSLSKNWLRKEEDDAWVDL